LRHKKHKPITDNKNINSTTEEYANYIQNQDDLIEEIAIFSGIKHQILNKNLKGGTIVAIFGGAELDFSQAQLSDEPNKLEMVCVFGGASLIIPPDWNVQINVVSILGGFADKRHLPNTNSIENQKMLIIKGISIFGGGEIKTFPR
jgi:predicted membrane protein